MISTGQFRAVRDISVAPIDSSDQALIIKMMDEPDGIMNVRKRKTLKHSKKHPEALQPLIEANEAEA